MKNYCYCLMIQLLLVNFSLAQDLYETDNITILTITFEEDNWNETLLNFQNNGQGERLIGSIEINGEPFDSVGIRYRGGSTFSSLFSKNPLNIKLDHIKNQDYQGFEVLKLSNGAKDPSFLREVASFELARQYMVAPLANYIQVFINGNYHGLYTNVESINSKFTEDRLLSDSDNPRFEANPSYNFEFPNPPFGCNQGRGAGLEYLGDGIICYFDHYEINGDAGWEALRDATEVLATNPDNIRQLIDVDRFLWMSALNNCLVNLDSYLGAVPNNYYLIQQDNGRFAPVMNDFNESFGRYPWLLVPDNNSPQTSEIELTTLTPFLGENDDSKPFLKTVFSNPTLKRMFVAHYRTILKENYANGALEERLNELQNLINTAVDDDPNALYNAGDFADNLNVSVTDFVDNQMAYGLAAFLNPRYTFLQTLPEFTATAPNISNINNEPANPLPQTQVTITAAIDPGSTVFVGTRETIKDAFILTPMLDDGNNGDGAAGDGIFGASIMVGQTGIQYYIYAENDDAGQFSPERAEIEFYTIGAGGEIVINEILADNENTQADQDGEFDDWAELYNNTDNSIDLSGWYLSDRSNNLTKWQFPNGTFIDGNSYLIVWVDDDEEQAGLHTSFTLSNSGEALILSNPNGEIVDRIIFGQQFDDVSMARCPNGVGAFEPRTPSFNADNSASCLVSTNELVLGEDYNIYPNPTDNQLFINVLNQGFLQQSVLISDLLGKIMLKRSFTQSIELDVSNFASGIYFLQLDNGLPQKIVIH